MPRSRRHSTGPRRGRPPKRAHKAIKSAKKTERATSGALSAVSLAWSAIAAVLGSLVCDGLTGVIQDLIDCILG